MRNFSLMCSMRTAFCRELRLTWALLRSPALMARPPLRFQAKERCHPKQTIAGFCGIQIRVWCESDNPTEVSDGDLDAEEEENSEDHWFKWIVVFGFFLGFSGAMALSY